MRRLARHISSHVRGVSASDEGATLVFIAVIMVALLALAAFAVDFGRIYEERRQLQNGADAAALAIAEDCARGLCVPGYDEYVTAESYVDDNARDGAANAWLVDLDLAAQTVTVHNRTEDPPGDNKFDMLFAGAVGFDGFTVAAKATVAWGNLLQGATIPIIISDCEWNKDDPGWPDGGSNLANDPPNYSDDEFVVVTFHSGNNTEDCNAQAGQDYDGDDRLEGGFGWLDTDGTCVASVYGVVAGDPPDYGWVQSDTGASPSQGCGPDELEALLLDTANDRGKTVFIPYFDDIWDRKGDGGSSPCLGSGPNHKCYHISGYGAFHVIGYNFGGQYREHVSPLTADPCRPGGVRPPGWTSGNSDRCLVGYFVEGVYTAPGDVGGTDRGVTVIKFTG